MPDLIGDNIVVPHHFHIVLTTLLAFWSILMVAPSMFFVKSAFTFQTGLLVFQGFLAGAFSIQAAGRGRPTIYDSQSRRYFAVRSGSDYITIGFGIAAAIGAMIYAGNLTLAILGCPGREVANCTGTITQAERTTSFATATSWDQICFDDFAITIAWIVLGYLTVIIDIVVIIFQMMLRETTLREFGQRASLTDLAPMLKQSMVLVPPGGNGRRLEFVGQRETIIPPSE
jgi:hypothetical protein